MSQLAPALVALLPQTGRDCLRKPADRAMHRSGRSAPLSADNAKWTKTATAPAACGMGCCVGCILPGEHPEASWGLCAPAMWEKLAGRSGVLAMSSHFRRDSEPSCGGSWDESGEGWDADPIVRHSMSDAVVVDD